MLITGRQIDVKLLPVKTEKNRKHENSLMFQKCQAKIGKQNKNIFQLVTTETGNSLEQKENIKYKRNNKAISSTQSCSLKKTIF